MTESAERMFQNFIDMAHDNQECPLCERALSGGPLKEFLQKVPVGNLSVRLLIFFCRSQLQDKLEKVPVSLKENEALLAESEALHQQLCDLRPVWLDHVRLEEKEIPAMKNRLAELDERKKKLDIEIAQVPHSLGYHSAHPCESAGTRIL